MSVAPRWKRRADEIAEAIGDELSINGTVSVGNDVSLSVATITALANAITSVLNPTTIARAMWTSDIVGTHDARAVYTVDGGGYWSITATGGVAGAAGSPPFIYQTDGTTLISARSGVEDRHEDVIFLNNLWQLPIAIVRNLSVLSTVQQPVHVELKNVTGGFTALGTNVSNAMKLSAQPISIASTVNVKTATNEAVAITGTVNANVGSVTVPISNPNNITVPVRATSTGIPQNASGVSVSCPVNIGSSTVPVKATAAGIPQNANGISLYLPVDANHGLTIPVGGGVTSIPVANTNSVTVAVSGGTTSIPISGGTASVPVANTNGVTVQISGGTASVPVANTNSVTVPVRTVTGTTNAADGTGAAVVVPVTSSGTVLDVKIVEISTATPSGGVAPITAFHEAMETALEEADTDSGSGVIVDYPAYVNNTNFNNWSVRRDDGVLLTGQSYKTTNNSSVQGKDFLLHNGNRVQFTGSTTWQQVNINPGNITVNQNPTLLYGVCEGFSGVYMRVRSDDDGVIYNANTIRISGTSPEVDVSSHTSGGYSLAEKYRLRGLRVSTIATDALTYARNWRTLDFFPSGFDSIPTAAIGKGTIHWATDTNSLYTWQIVRSDGTVTAYDQRVHHNGSLIMGSYRIDYRGRLVTHNPGQPGLWEIDEIDTI